MVNLYVNGTLSVLSPLANANAKQTIDDLQAGWEAELRSQQSPSLIGRPPGNPVSVIRKDENTLLVATPTGEYLCYAEEVA